MNVVNEDRNLQKMQIERGGTRQLPGARTRRVVITTATIRSILVISATLASR